MPPPPARQHTVSWLELHQFLQDVRPQAYHGAMELLSAPVATAE
jgi:hypothetical protein